MKMTHWLLAVCSLLLAFPSAGLAWRCGNLLVNKGTKAAAVELYCGQPVYRDYYSSASTESWVYGPANGAYRVLTIKNGEVLRVETRKKP